MSSTDQKWDRALDRFIRMGLYGGLAGGVAALLLFRNPSSRASVFTFCCGCSMGAAYSDTSKEFALPKKS